MSDPTPTEAAALTAERQMRERFDALSDDQQKALSKALFPQTHTGKVTVLGKERTLRPLTIKYARQLNAHLQAFQDKVSEGADEEKVVDLDLLDTVLSACTVIAQFYGWEDVLKAVEEEDCELTEMQGLVVAQTNLQDSNDFLLMGLRLLVVVMQQAEIEMTHLQNTFRGLL